MAKRKPQEFTHGAPAIDWVTVTTYNKVEYRNLWQKIAVVLPEGDKHGPGKRMQYVGREGEGFFYGEGKQDGIPHYMVIVTGAKAHTFAVSLALQGWHDDMRVTRLDVQYTTELQEMVPLKLIGQQLQEAPRSDWNVKGPAPIVDYFGNHQDLDTVYIGKRGGNRMQRPYIKVDGEGVRYLRWETEFRRALASEAWHAYRVGHTSALGAILKAEIDMLPCVQRVHFDWFARQLMHNPKKLKFAKPKGNDERTMQWLEDVVRPAIEGLLGSEQEERLAEWVMSVKDRMML